MTVASQTPQFATPRVAAGALFTNEARHVLMLRPTYKNYWDIPGGYVEPGESPLAACARELSEELGITPPIGPLLVVDWAPAENEGDKLLFIFDGGSLAATDAAALTLAADEVAELRYVATKDLDEYTVPRLSRRIRTAIDAKMRGVTLYAEHGTQQH